MSRKQWRGDGAARCWAVARKCALGLTLAMVCQSVLAQATYRIQPLEFPGGCTNRGVPEVAGFNGADQVAGAECNANGDNHAFLWKNNGTPLVDLGPPQVPSASFAIGINAAGLVGGDSGDFAFESSGKGSPMTRIYNGLGGSGLTSGITATAINDLGQLTGSAYTGTGFDNEHAFLWKNDGSPMLDLGTLGGNNSEGADINATGQVTGDSDVTGSKSHHAFVWKNDGTPMQDLGTLGGALSIAYYINASGQVAGNSDTHHSGSQHAFFWGNDGRSMQDLGTLGGPSSSLSALNDAGQIAGQADLPGSTPNKPLYDAFFWKNDGSPMQDLGSLGGTQSSGYGINSSGQVAGTSLISGDADFHAFLWRNDGTRIQDLNKLIDPTDPLKPYVTLTNGFFINDRSDIVAGGTNSRTGEYGLYLLQGAGVTASVLTLDPRSLAFGNVPVDSSSAAQSVTVTNTSAKAVAITSIALRGTAPGQFAFTDDCGKSLAAHATCTLKAIFRPTREGAMTAFLDVNGGGGGLRSVKLTGTGT